jgi:hypothetical protein
MGPCGPLPSCLHRPVAATPGRADRRAGRSVDRRPPGRPAPAPRPSTPACRRRRAPPPVGFTDRVLATLVILRFQLPHHPSGCCTGWTAPPSPVPSMRSAPCWPGAASPSQAGRACAFGPWPTWWPTPPPRASSCALTGPRPRSTGHGRTMLGGGRLSRARSSRNTIKVTTVCDRRGRTLWAGAVRPGRMHDQTAIKTEGIEELLRRHDAVHATVDAGYRGLAKALAVGSTRRRPSRPRTRHPRSLKPGSRPASSSPPSGSASSTPTPSTSSGGRCSAGSGGGSTTPRPTWPSPGWSPTGQPAADHHQPRPARPARPNLNRAPSRTTTRSQVRTLSRPPYRGLPGRLVGRLLPCPAGDARAVLHIGARAHRCPRIISGRA